MNIYSGRCTCGNIKLEFHSEKASVALPVRSCACSFCQSWKASYASDPLGRIKIVFRDETQVERFRFDTKTADFLICKNCNTYVAAIMGGLYAVINMTILEQYEEFPATSEVLDFSKETPDQRRARRIKSWTPVEISNADT